MNKLTEKQEKELQDLLSSYKAEKVVAFVVQNWIEKALKETIEKTVDAMLVEERELIWVNCVKHNLSTPMKELVKCKDCRWEVGPEDVLNFNQCCALQKEKGQEIKNKLKL